MRKLDAIVVLYKTGAKPYDIAWYLRDMYDGVTVEEVEQVMFAPEFDEALRKSYCTADDKMGAQSREIIRMLLAGCKISTIAEEVGVSWDTVRRHMKQGGDTIKLGITKMTGVEK